MMAQNDSFSSLYICSSTWRTGCLLCYPTFSECHISLSLQENWQTSTPAKLLTAFKIITFLLLWFEAKLTTSTSLFNQWQKCCSLFSQSYNSWPRILQAIHRSPLPPHVLNSAKTRTGRQNKKGEDKFQIGNLLRMLRKCFITFKKTVEVSVKTHMVLVPFLCHSLSFFSAFSTNKPPNIWVKPHACVRARVCVLLLFVQSELTNAGSGAISWQFALKLSKGKGGGG